MSLKASLSYDFLIHIIKRESLDFIHKDKEAIPFLIYPKENPHLQGMCLYVIFQ